MNTKKEFREGLHFLLIEVGKYHPDFTAEQQQLLERACSFAYETYQKSSDPTRFFHAVETTKILLLIKPDLETVITCLFSHITEDTSVSFEKIKEQFDEKIAALCKGVAVLSQVRIPEKQNTQVLGNLQKLFIALAKDIRVIFVRLSVQIHNMETLDSATPEQQKIVAKECLNVCAPIAEKLGLFGFKVRIEDMAFKYLEPVIYQQLSKDLKAHHKAKLKNIERAQKELLSTFEKEGFKIIGLQGRQKNIYSIYQKIKQKNLSSIQEIYDIFGFRVLVDSVEDCYRMLGMLHSHWKPMPNRFKDYISVPKTNGYQSLHTTVLGLGKSDLPTEIQIKTEKMHMDAEYGPAAHWAYKKKRGSHFDEDYIKRTAWLPEALDQKGQKDPEAFFREVSQFVLQQRIYVFTPTGEIKNLPIDATPVDFAYNVHSEIGNACIGATVNGSIKPLDYKLQNGDIVKILTKKGKKPNPDWLNFVQSPHAKQHIQNYVNKLKKSGKTPHTQKKEPEHLPTTEPVLPYVAKKDPGIAHTIIIGGERNLPFILASCCKPHLGQKIIAYKTRGLAFTIHRQQCKQLKRLDPNRVLEATFQMKAPLSIKAYDRVGLVKNYAEILARHSINIVDIKATLSSEGPGGKDIAHWTCIVEYPAESVLLNAIKDIESLENVIGIERLK